MRQATWEEKIVDSTQALSLKNGTALLIDYEHRFCGVTERDGRVVKWRTQCRVVGGPVLVTMRVLLDGSEIPETCTVIEGGDGFMFFTKAPLPEATTIDQLDFVFSVHDLEEK
jgi:hypothetical protein